MNRSQRHATLATLIVFTLASGDFFRYLLSWYGWGAIVASLLVWAIVELRSLRFSIRRLPWSLTLFLGFALATAVWSLHPPTTLLGVFLQLASAVGGIFLALIRFDTFRRALLWGTQLVVLASFVFEAFVALVLRRPIYPLWVHYDSSDHPAAFYWSRDLLLDGGRIQGITGNSNLLAMTALLALIVAVASIRRIRSRALAAVTIIAPIVALALTRSATVLVATIAVACVALFIALWRRMPLRHFQITTAVSSLIALALLSVAVLAREQLLAFIGKDSDLTGRFGIWESVIGQAMESPVIGNGFFGYWPPWVPPFDHLAIHGGVVHLMAHNVWLDVFMQLGAIGVLLWICVQFSAFKSAVATLRAQPFASTHALALLIVVALFVQGLTESRPLIELGFVLLVAVIVRGRERATASPSSAPSRAVTS